MQPEQPKGSSLSRQIGLEPGTQQEPLQPFCNIFLLVLTFSLSVLTLQSFFLGPPVHFPFPKGAHETTTYKAASSTYSGASPVTMPRRLDVVFKHNLVGFGSFCSFVCCILSLLSC